MTDKKLFALFVLTGAVNTVFGYGVFAIGIYIGLPYWLALVLSTILGIIFNFKTIGNFVFKSRDNSKFFKFLMVYIILYVVNLLLIDLGMILGLNAYTSGFISLFPVALLSFMLNKKLVFKSPIR